MKRPVAPEQAKVCNRVLPARGERYRAIPSRQNGKLSAGRPGGFTLVEVLVATAITLLLMGMVVTIFAMVGNTVSNSRATLEMADRLRQARHLLQTDLAGATARTVPPLAPEDDLGYVEVLEGPIGPLIPPEFAAIDDTDRDGLGPGDTTVGDIDDLVMLTTRSQGEPFVGRYAGGIVESHVAEIAWFVRGNTLYRRVLVVKPGLSVPTPPQAGFYADNDISVHQEGGTLDRNPSPGPVRLVANSLGDLTRREYRYAHQPYVFPHDARFWGALGLPTLRESSAFDPAQNPPGLWPFPQIEPPPGTTWSGLPGGATAVQSSRYADPKSQLIVPAGVTLTPSETVSLTFPAGSAFDSWANPYPWAEVDRQTGTLATYAAVSSNRVAEDVVLTNVLAFDVELWDPGAPVIADTTGTVFFPGDPDYGRVLAEPTSTAVSYGAYVDLNYGQNANLANLADPANPPKFSGPGDPRSGLPGGGGLASVYDTGSSHYERDGFNQNPGQNSLIDEGTDGFDNDGSGGADDAGELEAPPPYAVPLRGLRIKVRCFEPDSRQIREVTVVQEFLPE